MKTTSEYLKLLQQYMREKAYAYGISKMAIFGSVARGEQQENSDIDICFEGKVPTLPMMVHIKMELEELFGCKVDLVRLRDQMDLFLRKEILKDAIYA